MSSRAPGQLGGWVQLSVEELDGGRLVGDVGLSPAEDDPGVIKVGDTMSPNAQGRGYGTAAVRALIGYAFDTIGATIVRAYASAANIPSIRLAEKAGMRLVERIERMHDGEMWHGVRYEITREEYDRATGLSPTGFIPGRGDPRRGDGAWFDLDLQALRGLAVATIEFPRRLAIQLHHELGPRGDVDERRRST